MTHPARRYIAEAIPSHEGLFLAQWAYPGKVPDYVSVRGWIAKFRTAAEARCAAKVTMADALIRRLVDGNKPERYRFITGAEFAAELREAGITPTLFAKLYGTTQERVITDWVDACRDIPHPAHVLVGIFKAHPETVATAERITAAMTEARVKRETVE
jgi:hypothetical protein